MKIIVGSKNPVKVEAVREVLADYKNFAKYDIVGIETSSGVSGQPRSLEETIRGAINRSRVVFSDCSYSFGIESGLMHVPYTKTGMMNFCACVICDGINFHLGFSSMFELPVDVSHMIKNDTIDINKAFYRCGLTTDPKIGSSDGVIGFLTNNRVTRKEYTQQAVHMALIYLENKELYE